MTNIFGDFELDDKPVNILKARRYDEVIEFIVEWKLRENGFKPKNSVVTNLEFKKYNSDFLINFYEQRLIFGDTLRQQRNQISKQHKDKTFSHSKYDEENSNKKTNEHRIKIENQSDDNYGIIKNENMLSSMKKSIDLEPKRKESLFKI